MTQRKGIILGGMRDMLVFGTPQDTPRFHQLLDDASQWGLNLLTEQNGP